MGNNYEDYSEEGRKLIDDAVVKVLKVLNDIDLGDINPHSFELREQVLLQALHVWRGEMEAYNQNSELYIKMKTDPEWEGNK